MNTCMLMGNVSQKGIKTSTYGGDKTKVTFMIAIYEGKDEQGKNKSTYVPCVAFGRSAEMIAKYFVAGSPISVTAKFGTYEMKDNNGQKRYGYNFTVDNINFLPKSFNNANDNNNNGNGSFRGQNSNGSNNDNFFGGNTYKIDEDDLPFGM